MKIQNLLFLLAISVFLFPIPQKSFAIGPKHRSRIVVREIAWSPAGNNIATVIVEGGVGGAGERVEVYTAQPFALQGTIPNFPDGDDSTSLVISDIAWNSNGTQLAIGKNGLGATEPIVEIWDISTTPYQRTLRHIYLDNVISGITIAWRPNQQEIAYTCSERSICILDIASEEVIHVLTGDAVALTALKYSPDGELLLAGNGQLWDVDAEEILGTFEQSPYFGPFAWSPDGTQVTFLYEGQIRIWDAVTRQSVGFLEGTLGYTSDIYWLGQQIISQDFDGKQTKFRVWDQKTSHLVDTFELDASIIVQSFAVNPTGDKLAYGIHAPDPVEDTQVVEIISLPFETP